MNLCQSKTQHDNHTRVAQAGGDEIVLVCTAKADPSMHFNVRVNIGTSTAYYHWAGADTSGPAAYRATITPDIIEYGARGFRTRIDRTNGDWFQWNPHGGLIGQGSCRKSDSKQF